jgi:hypothetical protein
MILIVDAHSGAEDSNGTHLFGESFLEGMGSLTRLRETRLRLRGSFPVDCVNG